MASDTHLTDGKGRTPCAT